MINMDEAVKKYIRCHELHTACACDGVCGDCEFDLPDEVHYALYNLHQHILNNAWME